MKRRQKYNAKKQPCSHGHVHDSGREAKRCNELNLLLRAGEIESLEQQPKFTFTINGRQLKHKNGHPVGVTLDFAYWDRLSGTKIVEDTKGFVVRDWPLRRAVFCAIYPDLVLREV